MSASDRELIHRARLGTSRERGWLDGVPIVLFAMIVALMEAVAVLHDPIPALALVSVTARTSVWWFALTFAARPLVTLRPTPAAKWLLRNRRYLGLAMAVSHGAHLIGILVLAASFGSAFWRAIAPTTLIGGGIGYVLLAAMVVTSFDRTEAWLGRRRWKILHTTGMWFLWSIFTFTYVGQLGRSTFAVIATTVMLGLAALRIAAVIQRVRRERARKAARGSSRFQAVTSSSTGLLRLRDR